MSLRVLFVALGALLILGVVPVAPAHAAPLATAVAEPRHEPRLWMPINEGNDVGSVSALEYGPDGKLYIGGWFTHMGPPTGGFGIVDEDSGLFPLGGNHPYVDGTVYAAVADGTGGYFIGGDFQSVGGVERNNLAHMNADGSLDATWNPGATGGAVYALQVMGSYLYVGGDFTGIGGRSLSRLARVDKAAGTVPIVGFSPNPNSGVRALAAVGDTLYVGGLFSWIGGVERHNLAALDPSDALSPVESWNPDLNGAVWTLAVDNTYLFAGGSFTTVGGLTRNRVAQFSVADRSLTAGWDPSVNGTVYTIAINKQSTEDQVNRVLIGGAFTLVDGNTHLHAANVNYFTGETAGFIQPPSADGEVHAIVVTDTHVYFGGRFDTFAGQTDHRRIQRCENDVSLSYDSAWKSMSVGETVYCIVPTGDDLAVGGYLGSVGAHPRTRIAALEPSGELSSWYPTGGADGTVRAIEATNNGKLYVGGDFAIIGGQARSRLAELNPSTAAVVAGFNPLVNNTVYDIVSDGATVWIGGDFTTVAGVARNRIASITAAGALTDWYWGEGANDTVYALALGPANTTLYVGGEFTGISSVARNHLARLQSSGSAAVDSWNPNVTGAAVKSLLLASTTLYVGGDYTAVGGTPRMNLSAVNTGTAALLPWDPQSNGRVDAIARSVNDANATIYIGGAFTGVYDNDNYDYVAAVRPVGYTGDGDLILTSWRVGPNAQMTALAADATGVVVGGNFTRFYLGTTRMRYYSGVARFDLDQAPPVATMKINDDAPSTPSNTVTLRNTLSGEVPGYTLQRFKNSEALFFGAWEPYTSTRAWTLTVGDGTKTVQAEFKDESGNITAVSDTILYAATAANEHPVLAAIGDKAVNELALLTFTAIATDSDGDTLSYSLEGAPTGAAINPTTGVFTWTPTEGQGPGSYPITIVVRDGKGGSDSEAITVTVAEVSDTSGGPTVTPVAGTTRIETAVEASRLGFTSSEYVIIATARSFPDALGGSALAGVLDAPILLTEPTVLSDAVKTEIARLSTTKVIVLGGEGAVSPGVFAALDALPDVTAERLAGATRYTTAEMIAERTIAEQGSAWDGAAFVATGESFPDALGGSPIAAAKGWPIYLVHPNTANHDALVAAMKADGVTSALILGGTGPVPASFETKLNAAFADTRVDRLAGTNRYATAVAVATYGVNAAGLSWDHVAIATGENFPDALSGGALQGKSGSVMLLAYPGYLHTEVATALGTNKTTISEVRFLGGTGAVPLAIRNEVITQLQ